MLEITHLYKKYMNSERFSVEDLNLSLKPGEIFGFLGQNGAGKSTTIMCLTGIYPFNSGSITICGHDIQKEHILAKANFGYVTDEFTLFEKMTGFECLNFLADVYGVSAEDRQKRIAEFQEFFPLGDSLYQVINSYSHGMKQKISIMSALIHHPKVFILDEPMVGLDPYTTNQLKLFIKDYASKGNLVLFSSHNLDVVQKLCNRVYIIDQGRILEALDMDEFNKRNVDFEEYFLSSTKREARA